MVMAHNHRQARPVAAHADIPRTASDLRVWVRDELPLSEEQEARLVGAIESVLAGQRQLVEESKHEAIRALSEGFAEKMARLQRQLTEKDVTVSNIARYFEEVVADLTEKSHRDPKTKLLNFDWFMERSSRSWRSSSASAGAASASSTSTASSGTTTRSATPSATGSSSASRASSSDQIRSEDFLALERGGDARDLHARFGGDEFCFLIPDLPGCAEAVEIAERFKHAVEGARLEPRRSPAGDAAGARRRRRRLPAARAGRRAPRRGAQARRGTDPPRRPVDVRRQGQQGRRTSIRRPSTCRTARSSTSDGRLRRSAAKSARSRDVLICPPAQRGC